MTWIELADKHPDSAIILGILGIIGATIVLSFACMLLENVADLSSRSLVRIFRKSGSTEP